MARIAMIALMLFAAAPTLAQESDTSAPAPAAPADSNAPADGTVAAPQAPPPARAGGADLRESVCMMIESAARAQNLPLEFFAPVIWQESRFHPHIVGPRTRSGNPAQGIAQFIPSTAAERGLVDPFGPVQALPKPPEFL